MVIVYTIPDCPKCQTLKEKLDNKNIIYTLVEDRDIMAQKGFTMAPMLEVDNEIINYMKAIQWVNAQ